MKVSELINILNKCDHEGDVFIATNNSNGYRCFGASVVMESKMDGTIFIESDED